MSSVQSVNFIEDKIKLLLVIKGYNQNKIKFRGKNNRYIMYGYWNHIDPNDLQYVTKHVNINFEIIEWDDDDCGPLSAYNITERKQK